MSKHLHIVCFDVPYPADYGGVTDIFYRIKALYKIGVNIHLHCFDYGRGKSEELNKYCAEVNYYKRNTGWKGISLKVPYIVKSRANKILLQNILKDDHPVLLEGIHCTYFLYTKQLKNKKIAVRLHNVEFEYYHQLANSESSFLKKNYYNIESALLKRYERNIANKALFLAITKNDRAYFQGQFHADKIKYLPAFIKYENVQSKAGRGNYCLYHGNLSIAENEKAALWLVEKIFIRSNFPLIIAGKNPSEKLFNAINMNKNVSLVADPSEEKLNDLISNAQINILPSFNSTGIKIKLLNALFTGRHCLVTQNTIDCTALEQLCHVANNVEEFKSEINQLYALSFTSTEIEQRNFLLCKEFNNEENAKQLMQWIQ